MVVLFAVALAEAANPIQVEDKAFYADIARIEQTRFKTEEEFVAFRKQMAELDKKWLSLNTDRRALLFLTAAAAVRSSDLANTDEQYQYQQEYVLRGLENAFTYQISLDHEMHLVGYLGIEMAGTDAAGYTRESTLKAKLWIHAWRRLEEEASINFPKPPEPWLNLAPPPGSGALPGESPEVIKDPKLRREYEEAIQANNRKAELLNKWSAHEHILKSKDFFVKKAERFFIQAYSQGPPNLIELNAMLMGINDEDAKKRILEAIQHPEP